MRQLEDLLGERRAGAVDRLDGAADGVALVLCLVAREAAARLHGVGGDAIDHGAMAHHMVGLGEGGIDRALVAGLVAERLVAGIVVPHRRRARRQRGLGAGHRRQHLVVDLDQLGGVLGRVQRLGDDEGDGIADIAHALARQQRLQADEGGRAAAPLARHHGRERAEPAPAQILAGQDADHARRRSRPAHVDPGDARRRVRRAQHQAARLVRRLEVIDIAPGALEQPKILLARHRLTDRLDAHRVLSPRGVSSGTRIPFSSAVIASEAKQSHSR